MHWQFGMMLKMRSNFHEKSKFKSYLDFQSISFKLSLFIIIIINVFKRFIDVGNIFQDMNNEIIKVF